MGVDYVIPNPRLIIHFPTATNLDWMRHDLLLDWAKQSISIFLESVDI